MKMLAGFAGTVRSLTHVVIALLGLGIVVSLLGGNVPFVSGLTVFQFLSRLEPQ